MPHYRKKPVVIEAIEYTGTPESNREIIDWLRGSKTPAFLDDEFVDDIISGSEVKRPRLKIQTLEGDMKVDVGDRVIRGVQGEAYPCKPDIFTATYEPVEQFAGMFDGAQGAVNRPGEITFVIGAR